MGSIRTGWAAAAALVVAACNPGDRKLEERVTTELEQDPNGPQIGVEAKAKVVTLTGVVATAADRNRIEDRVRRVPGVLAVDDRITLAPPVEVTGADGGR
jgi:hypothetical protein